VKATIYTVINDDYEDNYGHDVDDNGMVIEMMMILIIFWIKIFIVIILDI